MRQKGGTNTSNRVSLGMPFLLGLLREEEQAFQCLPLTSFWKGIDSVSYVSILSVRAERSYKEIIS
jgi:hypothetical protein